MDKRALLVLADGSVYEGRSFGAEVDACGEVVFSTSMAGYQETLTDPSHTGQIVVATYPLIGNYGTNDADTESDGIKVQGLAVREVAGTPSHYQCNKTLNQYLAESGIPGIAGLDTRAVTRKLRSHGAMMGVITSTKTVPQALELLGMAPQYDQTDFVKEASVRTALRWQDEGAQGKCHVVALDCGGKRSLLRLLRDRGCGVTVVPCTATAQEIMALKPDGLFLSPGPGNPNLLDYAADNVRALTEHLPIMGVCLGNQLIARVFGGRSLKLKFGHHGSNHPVRDLRTGRVYITSQNHSYAPDPASLPSELEVSHVNLNDGTIEGLRHKTLPVFAVQYHGEASPGPMDSTYIFDEFTEIMSSNKQGSP